MDTEEEILAKKRYACLTNDGCLNLLELYVKHDEVLGKKDRSSVVAREERKQEADPSQSVKDIPAPVFASTGSFGGAPKFMVG